jgi:sulfur-oxidizing protein SoxZ
VTAKPKPRVKVAMANDGSGILEIETFVSHEMETGERKDDNGDIVPRNIIRRFECMCGKDLAFAADLTPAMSANPYIRFTLRPGKFGALTLTWTADDGSKIMAEVPVWPA